MSYTLVSLVFSTEAHLAHVQLGLIMVIHRFYVHTLVLVYHTATGLRYVARVLNRGTPYYPETV